MNITVADTAALQVRNVSKTFAGTRALKRVDFDVKPGEVHAVVGHNGSGKSTLVKILSGFYSADPDPETSVEVAGKQVKLEDPESSREAGLRFVHQDLGLVSNLNTIENMALSRGYETGFGRKIKWNAERQRTQQALSDIGLDFDISIPVVRLRASERTGIAVARALDGIENVRAIVFDEPSATLPTSEVETLFSVVKKAKKLGIGIIYISHRLDEIFQIADRVTVLRDGVRVATKNITEIDQDELIDLMVGTSEVRVIDRTLSPELGEVALEASNLCGVALEGIDFKVQRGEVVGIAGLTGSGRDELLSMLFGSTDRDGEVWVDGNLVRKESPRSAIAAGMGLVPPERIRQALFRSEDLTTNTTITSLKPHLKFGRWISRSSEKAETREWVRRLDVKPAKSSAIIGLLSGGNQQKIIMARWLRMNPSVLLLDEPTQGVDVAAKSAIHQLAREAAHNGAAVVMASSDEDELVDVCDRVIVIRNGLIAGELVGSDITRERIIRIHQ